MSCELAHLDGAYVLGALAPDERLAFERHLPGCRTCSAAVRDLAGLPGLLAQVSPDVVTSPPAPDPVPETLLPSLVAQVRRERRRRRWVTSLVAAAAVVVLGVAGAVVGLTLTDDDEPSRPPVAEQQQMVQVDQDVVEATVALTSVAWGTRVDVTCSYLSRSYGAEAPTYVLVVRTADGAVEQVATWRAVPGEDMQLSGATAVPTEEIVAVEVQDRDGHPLLELAT